MASDGRTYRWVVGALLRHLRVRSSVCFFLRSLIQLTGVFCLQLETADESKTLIARSHRSNLGIIGKQRNASLEISPAGQHIVDDIVVTFLWMEKIRSDRERQKLR